MKKFFAVLFLLILAIVPGLKISNVSAETTEEKKVKVVSDFCYLYLDLSNLNSCDDKTNPNPNNIRVEYGTELTLIKNESLGKEAGEKIIEGDKVFYFVKYGNKERYVLVENVVKADSNNSLTKKLDPNAKILNSKTKVYKSNSTKDILKIGGENVELSQYQEIKIVDGYDKNKAFHKIMFEQNGEILTGYVKTSDILVEGFNGTIILIVFIFVLVGSIVLSIVLATRKKRKKLKTKEQKQ